ncbi:hypothetical protein [Streptomyces gelaticus]|nr:hypothetical protein [Streptomyces gelaticus]
MSDIGKLWRYEDRLATYCEGLLPVAESAALTSYSRSRTAGGPHGRHG